MILKYKIFDKNIGKSIEELFPYCPHIVDPEGQVCSWDESQGWEVDHNQEQYEVLVFTGLTDRNGREIYEGDIVRVGSDKVGAIYYGSCQCTADDNFCGGQAFGFHVNREVLGNREVWNGLHTTGDNLEIIGNIHEHPELLQERDQHD